MARLKVSETLAHTDGRIGEEAAGSPVTKLDALAAAARQNRSPQTVQRQPQIQTPPAQLQSQIQEPASQGPLSTQTEQAVKQMSTMDESESARSNHDYTVV